MLKSLGSRCLGKNQLTWDFEILVQRERVRGLKIILMEKNWGIWKKVIKTWKNLNESRDEILGEEVSVRLDRISGDCDCPCAQLHVHLGQGTMTLGPVGIEAAVCTAGRQGVGTTGLLG